MLRPRRRNRASGRLERIVVTAGLAWWRHISHIFEISQRIRAGIVASKIAIINSALNPHKLTKFIYVLGWFLSPLEETVNLSPST